ncbi:MAG: hypothetical protein IPJ90_10095 [Anaerolineaceae bacterium]|nr:hypothetical protein [Anaerolineaceae bacterium]
MVTEQPIFITRQGIADLQKELDYLRKVKRPQMVEQMQEAKGNGDWMDQTEYMLIEAELAFLDGRILELQYTSTTPNSSIPATKTTSSTLVKPSPCKIATGKLSSTPSLAKQKQTPATASSPMNRHWARRCSIIWSGMRLWCMRQLGRFSTGCWPSRRANELLLLLRQGRQGKIGWPW